MIGSKYFEISGLDLVARGMSSGAYMNDGAFSPETGAVNLLAQPGVIYAPTAIVDSDTDTRLSSQGEIIASAPDHAASSGNERLLVAAHKTSQDGTFYRYDGTKIIAAAYATDSTNNYQKGVTDIINYRGDSYVTTKERIKKWASTGTITDLSGGDFADTAVPHPALVYQNNAYYGDGDELLVQTTAGGDPVVILTLAAGEIILALGIDEGTGKMLISTTTATFDISQIRTAINKVLWYDGSSPQVARESVVEDRVTAFHNHEGITFVGYGRNLGYLTGSGVKFLRRLNNVTNVFDQLPYKHSFASIGRTMFVIDGSQILAYGSVVGGSPIFYYAFKNSVNSNIFNSIFNAGGTISTANNKLGMSFEADKFYTLDITSKASITSLDLYSNWYTFAYPVYIRSMYIQLAEADNTANWTFSYFDQSSASAIATLERMEGNVTPVLEADYFVNFADSGNSAGNTGEGHQAVRSFKLRAQNSTTNKGIRKIIVYYDPAE